MTNGPLVSIVIPSRNEAGYIERCLTALLSGVYTNIEVLVADGASDDGTRAIVERRAAADARVRLVDNPDRSTPKGLNRGILAARGEYCAILGAHSEPAADWVANAVHVLAEHPEASAAGGILETISQTQIGRVIASVQSTKFGVGNPRFRVGGPPGYVDTVVFGCYRKTVFAKCGLFDEKLTTNQDDEFNLRLLAAGERLYFDPSIRCRYYARPSAVSFLNQYWRYGRFKCEVFFKNRRIGGVRQLAPAAWLVVVIAAGLPGFRAAGLLPQALICLYLAAGVAAMLTACRRLGLIGMLYLPLAIGVHAAYGAGTWYGLFEATGHRLLKYKTNS